MPDLSRRQRALDDMELLDTPAEPYLDTLVQLTRELFKVDSVLISLVDRDRLWFKARIGLDSDTAQRSGSFCEHAVLEGQPLIVENAPHDPRFANSPLVTQAPHICFYAGQPLYTHDGLSIGTLCLLHPSPRTLSEQERRYLHDLGKLVEGYLHMRSMSQQAQRLRQAVTREQRRALIDSLTQLWNRAALQQFYAQEWETALQTGLRLGLIYIDLDHFKQVNDQFGHAGGDQVLSQSARRMREAVRPDDLLVRLGGEEFVALVAVNDAYELAQIAERVRRAVSDEPMQIGQYLHSMTASMGTALAHPGEAQELLLERADRALYQAKQQGRNRVIHAP